MDKLHIDKNEIIISDRSWYVKESSTSFIKISILEIHKVSKIINITPIKMILRNNGYLQI